ncbi:hypothetical protein J31TS4_37290 [Paenibacillus sp. J31TS4]|uniref:DUF4097 family beta strand repeat-containing protein n=1 Tax=Paenibacillus sp. J31TS4 TaxID=2807195 RepID=UPI001B149D02|nr:DUF4097 family beta strand repeat-containing protein [Paenibacillus sp. J31TS4]GIP40449.1 hypothetical protein J31TS4_37290 [Paenibacillus sp. J31TS4]
MMKKIGFGFMLLLVLLLSGAFAFKGSWLDYRLAVLEQVEEADSGDIESVRVETTTVDVKVVRGSGSRIQARLYGQVNESRLKEYKLEKRVNGGKLELIVKEKTHSWQFGVNRSPDLEIELPEKLYNELAISMETGDLAIKGVSAKMVDVTTSTGDIELERLTADRVRADSTTGDTRIASVEGELDLSATTGDVTLDLRELSRNVSVGTTTGDIRLRIAGTPQAMRLDMKATTGETVSQLKQMDYTKREEHRIVGSLGSGGPEVLLTATTGDIRLQN